ncbi:MAG: hypothetical protein FWC72_07930 [Oscillospiraceae bacterium]|nr:hypothetical protein [Oscillospiraceae bacterium]
MKNQPSILSQALNNVELALEQLEKEMEEAHDNYFEQFNKNRIQKSCLESAITDLEELIHYLAPN